MDLPPEYTGLFSATSCGLLFFNFRFPVKMFGLDVHYFVRSFPMFLLLYFYILHLLLLILVVGGALQCFLPHHLHLLLFLLYRHFELRIVIFSYSYLTLYIEV